MYFVDSDRKSGVYFVDSDKPSGAAGWLSWLGGSGAGGEPNSPALLVFSYFLHLLNAKSTFLAAKRVRDFSTQVPGPALVLNKKELNQCFL